MKTLIHSKPASFLPFVFLCVLSALSGLSAGCSDDPTKTYTTARMFPENYQTIAVTIFDRNKDVYRRDVEIRLTEAIVKRVQQQTPYRVVERSRADTELTGELVDINQQELSHDPKTGKPQEMEAILTVDFKWKDRHGNDLMKRMKFSVSDTYIPPVPFREDFFQGSEAIINKIATLVVEQMESDW